MLGWLIAALIGFVLFVVGFLVVGFVSTQVADFVFAVWVFG